MPKSAVAGGGGGGTKRKHEPPAFDPQSYKSVKLDSETEAEAAGRGRKAGGGVTIRDVGEDGEGDDDDEDGRGDGSEFAPGQDADYYAEEDEDGRFLYVPRWPATFSSFQRLTLELPSAVEAD